MIQSLLTVNEQDIADEASGWTAGTNCTVSRSTILYREAPASLRLSPTTVGGVTMTVNLTRSLSPVAGEVYRVFCWARSTEPGVVVGIQPIFYDVTGTELEAGQHREVASTIYNRWVLVTSEFTVPANTVSAKVRLDSEAVSGGTWFDGIGFVPWGTVPRNPFMRLMYRTIPDYMEEADDTLTDPDHPLYRYIDLVASTADNILTTALSFDYVSPVDGWTGYDRSTLVQPEYYPTPYAAEAEWLPWLSQLLGVRAVYPVSGGSLTPWYVLEESYPTWNAWQTIDPAVNPAFPVSSISRNGTTGIVTAVYGTQSAGSAYTPVVGDPVEVAGTSGFNGAFVILSVNTGTKTLTWSDPGSTASGGAAGTITYSDVSWSEAEGVNPSSYDALAVLKHLTRTASTGLRAGSTAAIVNAARAVLDGKDIAGAASRTGNVVTVATDTPHTFGTGDYIRICESSEPTIEIVGTVASVPSATSLTVASTGPDTDTVPVYVTSKQVTVVKTGTWTWTVNTRPDQTTSSDLLEVVVTQAKPAGVLVTFGSI